MPRPGNTKRSRGKSERSGQASATVSPNRTSDDSPGTETLGQRSDLRDPLRAPGQLPPYVRSTAQKTALDADESYGNTQIPRDSRGGSLELGKDGARGGRDIHEQDNGRKAPRAARPALRKASRKRPNA
jgi:hypothetical protein